MHPAQIRFLLATTALCGFVATSASAAATADNAKASQEATKWVSEGPDGHLHYKTLATGDRIMDFSYAGYRGGGVALPQVAVMQRVPVPAPDADATASIQQAIDAVSAAPLHDGVRGAVLLEAGTYRLSAALAIRAAGVVLRGSGSGDGGTILSLVGQPHAAIAVTGEAVTKTIGETVAITADYVPSGTSTLQLQSAADLHVGDQILVNHPVTRSWIHFMGMDTLVRNGKPETWLAANSNIAEHRRIAGIDRNRITLDIPLSDCLDQRYLRPPGASVVRCSESGQIAEVGIEHLAIQSPVQSVTISEPSFRAIKLTGATDSWVDDVRISNTIGAVDVAGGCSRVTVRNVTVHHQLPTKGAAKPADFDTDGTQVLFDHCNGDGDALFYFATMGRDIGPIVMLHCTFHGNGHIQPHMRWSTGLLIDNCDVPGGGIDFMDRGIYGSGHGWTMGWAVAWNCRAKTLEIDKPPGAMNWAIGCSGEVVHGVEPASGKKPMPVPRGEFESLNEPVQPQSLYLAQLKERLGEGAVKASGD